MRDNMLSDSMYYLYCEMDIDNMQSDFPTITSIIEKSMEQINKFINMEYGTFPLFRGSRGCFTVLNKTISLVLIHYFVG